MISKKTDISVRETEEIRKEDGVPTRTGVYFSPAVDIYETEEAITVLADLPGVEQEKLDINVEDRQLTFTGLVDEAADGLHPVYTEYRVGGYTRTFRLGDTIDQAKISANLKDGVLTLVLPKAERLKPRRIAVNAS